VKCAASIGSAETMQIAGTARDLRIGLCVQCSECFARVMTLGSLPSAITFAGSPHGVSRRRKTMFV
jgi:hypothetical protein